MVACKSWEVGSSFERRRRGGRLSRLYTLCYLGFYIFIYVGVMRASFPSLRCRTRCTRRGVFSLREKNAGFIFGATHLVPTAADGENCGHQMAFFVAADGQVDARCLLAGLPGHSPGPPPSIRPYELRPSSAVKNATVAVLFFFCLLFFLYTPSFDCSERGLD